MLSQPVQAADVGLERARFRRRISVILTVASAAVLLTVNAPALDAWMVMDVRRAWIVGLASAAAPFALPGVPIGAPPGTRVLVRPRPLVLSVASV